MRENGVGAHAPLHLKSSLKSFWNIMRQAVVLMASPVVSLTCTFGTMRNKSLKSFVNWSISNASKSYYFLTSCLSNFADLHSTVQECDATKA
jgi:hypothetical protein